jgi:DNA-binding beta-propeller fold protein YncE
MLSAKQILRVAAGLAAVTTSSTLAACGGSGSADTAPAPQAAVNTDYYAYVGAESADLLHVVRYGPGGAEVSKTFPVGVMAVETEGPHGLRVSPDGEYLYMTTGHGVPDGYLWKFEAGADTLVADPILLGQFPATMDITPDGLYLFGVNFNLHGEMVPSTISVVYTPDMIEMAQVETCTMPHGARMNPSGTRLYSACMMDDQLVEIDTGSWQVTRRFSVAKGAEGPIEMMAHEMGAGMDHSGHDMGGMSGMDMGSMPAATCSPTWAQPSADGTRIYVACNRGDEVLEIDAASWELLRKFPAGRGPYNLDLSPDGRLLVATLKQGAQVEVFDLETGQSLGRIDTSTTVAHGVVITPDSRFAFISVEGVGAEPGKVDIIDLQSMEMVGDVEVGQQAGGIAFWRMGGAH